MRGQKKQLRRRFRQARAALSAAQRHRAEKTVVRRLKPLVKRGRKIAAYWALGSELRPDGLFRTAWRRGAEIYLPHIVRGSRRMWFTPYREGMRPERGRGQARLQVPQFAGRKIRAERLDVILLPVVAADRHGFRLGQAGGYYDATLARCRPKRPLRIAVGFSCQLADQLPREPHDIPLHGFVSERHNLRFKSPAARTPKGRTAQGHEAAGVLAI
ncbi:MAG: 5-formyltetrahydrofolate cyclo-ligase [Neisseria sp.]|nr:5-formyltetrahydrofolate cyclo-ligase [Neisseria sp.]